MLYRTARHRCGDTHRRLFCCCHRGGIDLPWRDGGDPNLFVGKNELTRKGGARKKSEKSSRIPRLHRFSTVELLVALALLFFFFPFVEEVKGGDVILSILFFLVLVSAVLDVADRKGVFFIALLLAIPAIAGRWINHFRPDLVPPPVFLIAGL